MPSWPPFVEQAGLPPGVVIQEQLEVSAALDALIPDKRLDRNLLLASWNVRMLGGVNPAWRNVSSASPKRNLADIWAISEIISRFDVVALQEVRDDLTAFRSIISCLGDHWSFTVTNTFRGAAGNQERLAFLFDRRRATHSGLAGELVLSNEDVKRLAIGRQFARAPYIVSFDSAGNPFTLLTVHVIWGEDLRQRTHEASAVADLVRSSVRDVRSPDSPDVFKRNLIALGDFNISRTGDETYQALEHGGLSLDPHLADLPRTVGSASSAFDQFAWIGAGQVGALGLDRTASGVLRWTDVVPREKSEGNPTFRISDHFPLWIEFALPAR